MTMIEELENREAELSAKLGPIYAEIGEVRRRLKTARSVEWIKANGATRYNVEQSDIPGLYFGTLPAFADYLASKPDRKRFAEWFGLIYHTDDLIAGRLPPNVHGRIWDLPE